MGTTEAAFSAANAGLSSLGLVSLIQSPHIPSWLTSWLPSMYSDTTNYPSVFTFWKLYLSAPAQQGTTIYLSITAWVNGISSLILCIDPNFSVFKMGVILGIAYFSHITLIIFYSSFLSLFKDA